jgi:hypothetical protein
MSAALSTYMVRLSHTVGTEGAGGRGGEVRVARAHGTPSASASACACACCWPSRSTSRRKPALSVWKLEPHVIAPASSAAAQHNTARHIPAAAAHKVSSPHQNTRPHRASAERRRRLLAFVTCHWTPTLDSLPSQAPRSHPPSTPSM